MVRKAPTVAVASSTAPGVWETDMFRDDAAAISTEALARVYVYGSMSAIAEMVEIVIASITSYRRKRA